MLLKIPIDVQDVGAFATRTYAPIIKKILR
jgi:hypothetical protein